MKKNTKRRIVLIIGIIITIIGWIISNADRFPSVYRIFAPEYLNSISAFNRMHEKNFILKEGEVGFSEIAEILKEQMTGTGIPIITQAKTLGWGQSVVNTPEGQKWFSYIKLEVSFSNAQPATGKFWELKSEIEKKYLTPTIFSWKGTIFWIGIGISLIAVFL